MKYITLPREVPPVVHYVERQNSPKTYCGKEVDDIPIILTGVTPDQTVCANCQAVKERIDERRKYYG